jgi:DNA-binding beta-propeller fold protein YncE
MPTKKITVAFLLILVVLTIPVMAHSVWSVTRTIKIGGEGGWDYLTVDPQTHRLYVPRTTHTMVIDSDSGQTMADIPGQKRAHGVAIVSPAGRGFISDGGGDGAVVIFDLKTNAVLGTIATQPDTDGIIFDQSSGRVLSVSGDNGVLMSFKPDIDPKTGKMEPPIELGGKPEFLSVDGKGKAYINLVDKNVVVVVDLDARKVTTRWSVAPGGAPVGMSMDVKKRLLFIGCRNPQKLIVMSADDGKVLSDLPIGPGVDATKLDGDLVFASCADGSLAVAKETSPSKFEIVQTVKTSPGAKTMGVDPTTNKVFLPMAEFEAAAAGARPRAKPGTFMILVVENRKGVS